MTQTDFKTILNVTADGVVTGDLWGALAEFERSRAEERQKIHEERRLDELRRAHSVPGVTEPKHKGGKKRLSALHENSQSAVYPAGSFISAFYK